ncbi:MAG: MoxR family ATPase [Gemmatimonadales bacterium]|nr:MoxR family ATPase [Gemmatimonadales bacterium]
MSAAAVGAAEAAAAQVRRVEAEVAERIVGQQAMVERLLVGLLAGGHVLLEGVPGLAKTLAVRTLAETIDASFARIQFTPDLLPADVIGTMVFDPRSQQFSVKRGPVFAHVVLADEINRAPAKVQAALLEAMQERQVTIGGQPQRLDEPFLVLATQNPIESEGTYPLPEAQLDRFLLKVTVGYPTRDEERELLARGAVELRPVRRVVSPADVLAARAEVAALHADPRLLDYVVDLVRATREPQAVGLGELRPLIACGASPRAAQALLACAKAHAWLRGRHFVVPEDVRALAPDVLRHRLVLTFEADAAETGADEIVRRLLAAVPAP